MSSPPAESPDPVASDRALGTADRAITQALRLATLFCAVLVLGLTWMHFRLKRDEPLKSPALTTLKLRLQTTPKDETLKNEIRELDLRLRERYFTYVAHHETGAWLLAGGLCLLVWLGRELQRRREQPHRPRLQPQAVEQQAHHRTLSRTAVALTAFTAVTAALALGLSHRSKLPQRVADVDRFLTKLQGGEAEGASPMPSAEEFLANWPRFLGPTGNAWVTNTTLTTNWDVASGRGIVWRTAVSKAGFNSPIVWSNRVFISAGDATQRVVFAYDAGSGALAWQRRVENVPGSPARAPEIPEGTGFAASTMATDGRRVYAVFANGDLAAFRLDGTPAWAKNVGVPKNQYGHATSLATWQDHLIVQLDQGEAEQNRSRLYLFDGPTGRPLWERTRPVPNSWASPIVFNAAGQAQIVALGGQWAIAYSANDGTERWRADVLAGEIAPSPIFAGGLVIVPSPSDRLTALRPDGQGDVTQSHAAWSADDNVPDITTPVADNEFVYTVSTPGTLTCFDLKDGKKQWELELDTEVHATPLLAGGRLYIFGNKGAVLIVQGGRTSQRLARLELGEAVNASPAVAGNRLFVRSAQTLWCLGDRPADTPILEAKP